MVDAFSDGTALQCLLSDRDTVYGDAFADRRMGIADVVSTPAGPWQNPDGEHMILSIRRECLDHLIIIKEAQRPCLLEQPGT